MKPIHPRLAPFFLCLLLILTCSPSARGENPTMDAETLLKHVETRVGADGFSAQFFQEAPLKAIGIIETAEGSVWFRKPDLIRWEYATPDRLHYITDGETLWIHSLEDNQVWIGSANDFFGSTGGARFLADITSVAERFTPAPPKKGEGSYQLILTSKSSEDILERVELTIDAATFDIIRVISTARTGEETTLTFHDFVREKPELSRFTFETPKGAVVTPLG